MYIFFVFKGEEMHALLYLLLKVKGTYQNLSNLNIMYILKK